MRTLEQITVEEVMEGEITIADVALYGGLIAIGFFIAAFLVAYVGVKMKKKDV